MSAAHEAGFLATLKRTATEFQEDNLTDWAAALTYYGLLALFPALIAMVSLIGLVRRSRRRRPRADRNHHSKSAPNRRPRPSPARSNRSPPTRAPRALPSSLGLAVALWSASGYVGAFIRASNVIYETPGGAAVLEAAAAADRGHPGDDRADGAARRWRSSSPGRWSKRSPGRSASATPRSTIWNIAKWPVMVAIFIAHGRGPLLRVAEREAARLQMGDAGSLVAIVVWVARLGRCSPSTSPTSAPTTRPTARSAG